MYNYYNNAFNNKPNLLIKPLSLIFSYSLFSLVLLMAKKLKTYTQQITYCLFKN